MYKCWEALTISQCISIGYAKYPDFCVWYEDMLLSASEMCQLTSGGQFYLLYSYVKLFNYVSDILCNIKLEAYLLVHTL